MAKSYKQRNEESIAKYGKSLYQRRLESGLEKGLTPKQARGHAPTPKQQAVPPQPTKPVHPPTTVQPTPKQPKAPKQPKTPKQQPITQGPTIVGGSIKRPTYKPPAITKRVENVAGTRVRHTRNGNTIWNELSRQADNKRVYFQIWDPNTGKNVNLYYGKRNKPNGITVGELKRRITDKMATFDYDDYDNGIWDVFEDDGDSYLESEGGTGPSIPSNFSSVSMYIR